MYLFLEILGFVLSKLPDQVLYRLAQALTGIGFSMLRLRRRLVLKNLEIAFPQITHAHRLRLGREAYLNFVLTALEFLRAKHIDLARSIQLEDRKHLDSALAQGQGAYILCLHMGNWEAMGSAINQLIIPARVVVKNVGRPSVDRWVNEVRRKNGFQVIKRQKKGDGIREILKTLKAGEIVGFVMDQARPGEPKLPFFGKPAKTNTGLAGLWMRRPAPIIPSYAFRTNVGEHTIRFLPELSLPLTGNKAADIAAISTRFNEVIADIIKEKPEHYFWLHNRWK